MPNTEQIIKVLKNERECIKRQTGITAPDGSIGICDRNCAECDLCLPDTEILEVYDHLIAQLETTAIEVKLDEENKAKLLELLRESQGNLVKLPIGECGFIDNLPDGVIEATTLDDVENGERAFIKGIGFGKGDTE